MKKNHMQMWGRNHLNARSVGSSTSLLRTPKRWPCFNSQDTDKETQEMGEQTHFVNKHSTGYQGSRCVHYRHISSSFTSQIHMGRQNHHSWLISLSMSQIKNSTKRHESRDHNATTRQSRYEAMKVLILDILSAFPKEKLHMTKSKYTNWSLNC